MGIHRVSRVSSVDQMSTKVDLVSTVAVAEKTEMPDAHESFWQYVDEKASNELLGWQGHGSDPVPLSVILPTKGYLAVAELHQTMVGNGDAMSIATEISEDLGRPSERGFGVDDPVGFSGSLQVVAEGFWIGQGLEGSIEVQLPVFEGLFEVVQEFSNKHPGKDTHRKKEPFPPFPTANPACVVWR